jgi:replicative DNA helicase
MIEKTVLSYLFKNPAYLDKMENVFQDHDIEHHYKLFQAIYAQHKTLTPAILVEKKVSQVFLSELIEMNVSADDFESCMKILEERNQTKGIQNIIHRMKNNDISFRDAKKELTMIMNIAQRSQKENIKHIQQVCKEFLEEKPEQGLQTGFSIIDTENDGLNKGELIIIAARPSTGKTAVIINMISRMYQSYAIGYFSAEMQDKQNLINIVAHLCKIDNLRLRKKVIDNIEQMKIATKFEQLSKYDLYIDDTCGIDIDELYIKAEYMKNAFNIEILFVDYLQLLGYSGQTKNDKMNEKIGYIVKKLKQIARHLNIPVVCACQINRIVDRLGDDYEPKMADLKDSGDIEQTADMVMFLQKVKKDKLAISEEGIKQNNKIEVIKVTTGKNRNGSTPMFYLKYTKNFCLMENYDFYKVTT